MSTNLVCMSSLDRQLLAKYGEDQAVTYLVSKSYQIVERNWRWKNAEVDIIARTGDILVFIEVKTRSYDYYGDPAASVSAEQEARLADAANAYMLEAKYEGELRFDTIGVINQRGSQPVLRHYEDVFFPGQL